MKRIISTFAILIAAATSSFAQAPVATISGNITGTANWSADTIYKLTGKVYVKAGATLNIAPGTIVKGDKSTPGSALIVARGAKIYAIGTTTKPIVFTSSEAPGNKTMGDWGGLVIAGNARINVPGGIGTFEGGNLANPDGTASDGQYGGLNDLDNSGELKYVRIEYAGFAYAPNNEINGLTLGAVGSGTKISHVQVSYGLDDAFEWYGGTVNCDHLISFRGNDDDFDTDFGYSGKVQFGLCLRDTLVADAVSGANGFESDNDGSGSGNNPYTSAIFSNMTMVGPRQTATTNYSTDFKRGAHIRRNSRMNVFNSIFMGWPVGVKIDGDSCHANADNAILKVKNTVIAGSITNLDSTAGATWNITPWYTSASFNNTVYTDNSSVMLSAPFNYANPNFRPMTGSPVLTGADFADPNLTGYTTTTYRGAFGTDDWTAGWTNFNPDTASYAYGYISVGINEVTVNQLDVNVYPNPTSTESRISFTLNTNAAMTFEILDVNGNVLVSEKKNFTKGFNAFSFPTAQLANGFYIVKLSGDNYIATQKLSVLK